MDTRENTACSTVDIDVDTRKSITCSTGDMDVDTRKSTTCSTFKSNKLVIFYLNIYVAYKDT